MCHPNCPPASSIANPCRHRNQDDGSKMSPPRQNWLSGTNKVREPLVFRCMQAVRTSKDPTQQIIGWVGKRSAALVMLHAKSRSVLLPLKGSTFRLGLIGSTRLRRSVIGYASKRPSGVVRKITSLVGSRETSETGISN